MYSRWNVNRLPAFMLCDGWNQRHAGLENWHCNNLKASGIFDLGDILINWRTLKVNWQHLLLSNYYLEFVFMSAYSDHIPLLLFSKFYDIIIYFFLQYSVLWKLLNWLEQPKRNHCRIIRRNGHVRRTVPLFILKMLQTSMPCMRARAAQSLTHVH